MRDHEQNIIPRPYALRIDIPVISANNGRLGKSPRNLTHLQRYLLKEADRERVLGLDRLTRRAQIGRRE